MNSSSDKWIITNGGELNRLILKDYGTGMTNNKVFIYIHGQVNERGAYNFSTSDYTSDRRVKRLPMEFIL